MSAAAGPLSAPTTLATLATTTPATTSAGWSQSGRSDQVRALGGEWVWWARAGARAARWLPDRQIASDIDSDIHLRDVERRPRRGGRAREPSSAERAPAKQSPKINEWPLCAATFSPSAASQWLRHNQRASQSVARWSGSRKLRTSVSLFVRCNNNRELAERSSGSQSIRAGRPLQFGIGSNRKCCSSAICSFAICVLTTAGPARPTTLLAGPASWSGSV